MTTDRKHQEAIALIVAGVLNDYLKHHLDGVRVDVMQAALGEIVTESFWFFEDRDQRLEMLDSFCDTLRATVELLDGVAPKKRVLS